MDRVKIFFGIVVVTIFLGCEAQSDYDGLEKHTSTRIHIPDANFRKALDHMVFFHSDGTTYINNVSNITNLIIKNKGIKSLAGIEYFTSLDYLICSNNQLTNLDVSANTALDWLVVRNNQLTNLDISANTALRGVHCGENKLSRLDVSANTALIQLTCDNNKLTSLDVSKNTDLTYLGCDNNKLTSLDISANTYLTLLSCENNQLTSLNIQNGRNTDIRISTNGNPNLKCIQVDDADYTTSIRKWADYRWDVRFDVGRFN